MATFPSLPFLPFPACDVDVLVKDHLNVDVLVKHHLNVDVLVKDEVLY